MISVENLSMFTSDHQLLLKNIQFSVQEKEWLHLKGLLRAIKTANLNH